MLAPAGRSRFVSPVISPERWTTDSVTSLGHRDCYTHRHSSSHVGPLRLPFVSLPLRILFNSLLSICLHSLSYPLVYLCSFCACSISRLFSVHHVCSAKSLYYRTCQIVTVYQSAIIRASIPGSSTIIVCRSPSHLCLRSHLSGQTPHEVKRCH